MLEEDYLPITVTEDCLPLIVTEDYIPIKVAEDYLHFERISPPLRNVRRRLPSYNSD